MSLATIVIPQRGNQHLTERLVTQIERYEPAAKIIIVDDAVGEEFAAQGPIGKQTRIVPNPGRYVTTAWNHGVALSWTQFVILLNNDVVCHGPFVSRMVASASGGISGARSRYEPDLAATVLEGWCLCFSRLLFDELGGFDDSMRLYFSDTDFQKRATTAGHPLNVAAVSLGHIGHQTAHNHRLSPDQPRLWREDRIAFLNKHGMVSR